MRKKMSSLLVWQCVHINGWKKFAFPQFGAHLNACMCARADFVLFILFQYVISSSSSSFVINILVLYHFFVVSFYSPFAEWTFRLA